MTASILLFELTDWSTGAGTNSATALIASTWDPINNNDRFYSYSLGSKGIIIKIDATS